MTITTSGPRVAVREFGVFGAERSDHWRLNDDMVVERDRGQLSIAGNTLVVSIEVFDGCTTASTAFNAGGEIHLGEVEAIDEAIVHLTNVRAELARLHERG